MTIAHRRVLVVFAHPDDETLLAGALIPRLIADGNEVHLLCVAPGDDADLFSRMEQASAELGIVNITSLRFSAADNVSYTGTETRMPPLAEAPESAVAHLIEGRIAEIAPNIIITHSPDGDYGHPDHAFCHRATVMAASSIAPTVEFYALAWPRFALSLNRVVVRLLSGFRERGTPKTPAVVAATSTNVAVTHVYDVRRYLSQRKRAARHYRKEIAQGPLPMRLLEVAPVALQSLVLGKARLSRVR